MSYRGTIKDRCKHKNNIPGMKSYHSYILKNIVHNDIDINSINAIYDEPYPLYMESIPFNAKRISNIATVRSSLKNQMEKC